MSLQKISVAGFAGNALRLTFTLSRSRVEIELVLANQTNAMTWRAAGLANYA